MNYRLEDIPREGLLVREERDENWLEDLFQGQKGLQFTCISPIFFEIRLSHSDSMVLVEGSVRLTLRLTCSRCVEQFIYSMNPEFKFLLSPVHLQKLPPEVELQREDLDMEFYNADVIDVRQIIHNQVILTIPFNPLCKEDCRGLCPHCGINRNQETCNCSEEQVVHPKLAVLKNFFKK